MILPAGIARFWSRDITGMICIAVISAILSAPPAWCCRSRPGCRRARRSSWSRLCSISLRCCSAASAALVRRALSRPPSRSLMRRASSSPHWRWRWPEPAACGGGAHRRRQFSILADFVKNVGGDKVDLTTLVGPNSDVHVYAPAPSDAKRVADVWLLIINGLGLEGWLPRLVQSSGSKAMIVTASNGIAPLSGAVRRPIRMPGSRSPMRKSMWPISETPPAPTDPGDAADFRAKARTRFLCGDSTHWTQR